MKTQTATYEVRLSRGSHESALTAVVNHLSLCERKLHARLDRLYRQAESEDWSDDQIKSARNTLKSSLLIEFGLTGRQYNALLRGLEGRYKSLVELAKLRIENIKDQIRQLDQKVQKRDKTLAKSAAAARAIAERKMAGKTPTKKQLSDRKSRSEMEKLRFANHGQKRRIAILSDRLQRDQKIAEAKVPKIVFGSKSLLRKRSQIHSNDRQAIEIWRHIWERSRASQFLVIGSKGETTGCQSCVLSRDGDGLKVSLRVPNALTEVLGKHVTIRLGSIPEHGREALGKALKEHEDKSNKRASIAYRFVRETKWHDRKRLSAWKVFISIDREVPEVAHEAFDKEYSRSGKIFIRDVTDKFCGALGVDLNADHLAYAAIDRSGNPIRSRSGRIDLPLRNKTSDQRSALIGDASAEIVRLAKEWGLPIVLEQLDFSTKKRDLKAERRIEYRRMLSSLAYASIQTTLRRRAEREAVELVEVNPAYTSTIGRVNFARRYGLSTHIAAAVAIARRSAHMSERINYVNGYRGRRNTLPAPVEARKHIWRQWSLVRKDLAKRDLDDYRLAAGIASSARPLKGRIERSVPSG